MAGDTAWRRELPEQSQHPGSVLANVGIDLAIGAFEPASRHQGGAAMPRSSHVDRLLAREINESRNVRVNKRKPRAGTAVAKQPRLDVVNPEGPFEQRIVSEVDLADCQVIAGSPPRVNGGQLTIGKCSKFVSGPFQGHTLSLVPVGSDSEGRRSRQSIRCAISRRCPK